MAIRLKAELLLIDEVLGVGDARFEQKNKTAMIDKVNSVHSIIIVSHSFEQITIFCNRVVWLEMEVSR